MSKAVSAIQFSPRTASPLSLYTGLLDLASRIPLSLPQLATRIAIGMVFWNSAQTKLASWPVTNQLFAFEYKVPLLPPELAATLATYTELGGAVALFLGLFTRLGALALLGVTAVIQVFVFPGHWAEHLLWASGLLLLVARGAGFFSLDHVAGHWFGRER